MTVHPLWNRSIDHILDHGSRLQAAGHETNSQDPRVECRIFMDGIKGFNLKEVLGEAAKLLSSARPFAVKNIERRGPFFSLQTGRARMNSAGRFEWVLAL